MTESDTIETTEATDEQPTERNLSTLREMALRGDQYRESMEVDYYGMQGDLYYGPLPDPKFIPIAAMLQARMGIDTDEAQEMLEEEKDEEGNIDPSEFDDEFVEIMANAAIAGIDTEQGIAEGETEEGLQEIFGYAAGEAGEGIGLQGGLTLVIAERILNCSSNAGDAEKFRRDGGGE